MTKTLKKAIAVMVTLVSGVATVAAQKPADKSKKEQPRQLSPLDKYIQEASLAPSAASQVPSNGSLWSPSARFSDLASDLRARRVDDIVTILVAESATAASTGTSKTARTSSAQANIAALGGITKAAGPLANLLNLGSSQSLNGQGATSRQTTLTTTVSARVTHVLANGNLVVEGTKNVTINTENQVIVIRGVIRPIDLDTTNSIQSARLAQMEVQVNGKGIVGDVIRRPNILYRLILGLLPF
ncbi:MAG TPA: flagellar basal body L-ring protein FlgH [Bryobacteraceae bacterium]|jgi:flagellar L-ring protein precursor FlgH